MKPETKQQIKMALVGFSFAIMIGMMIITIVLVRFLIKVPDIYWSNRFLYLAIMSTSIAFFLSIRLADLFEKLVSKPQCNSKN